MICVCYDPYLDFVLLSSIPLVITFLILLQGVGKQITPQMDSNGFLFDYQQRGINNLGFLFHETGNREWQRTLNKAL